MKLLKSSLLLSTLFLSACIGTIIETTTDAAIAVAKIPFKVGGAIVDVVSGDDDDDFAGKGKAKKSGKSKRKNEEDSGLE